MNIKDTGKLYNRVLSIDTDSAIHIDAMEFKCQVHVWGAEIGAPNRCEIKLYNVSTPVTTSIMVGNIIAITAGYKSVTGIIFTGEVRNISYGKENGIDTFMLIQCQNNLSGTKIITGKTYPKNSVKSTTAIDAFKSMGFITLDGGATLPTDMYKRPKVVWGIEENIIKTFERSYGVKFIVDGTNVSSVDLNNLLVTDAVVLNSETGLVGRPFVTQNGIEGTCLLNPRLKVGSAIQIVPDLITDFKLDLSYAGAGKATASMEKTTEGLYWIAGVEYKLDTRGTEWYVVFKAIIYGATRAPFSKKQLAIPQ